MCHHSWGNMSSSPPLYTAVSSWNRIHHPLHLALAHMGQEQAHQGHCLWLILKSMRTVFMLHAIHLCFCFFCLQRFALHIGPKLQHRINPIITPLLLHILAFMFDANCAAALYLIWPKIAAAHCVWWERFLILIKYSFRLCCRILRVYILCVHTRLPLCRIVIHVYLRSQWTEEPWGTCRQCMTGISFRVCLSLPWHWT